MCLELDLAINRDGIVEPSHARRYKQLGSWIKNCYGNPVSSISGSPGQRIITLPIPDGRLVDRIILQEDMSTGQTVRSFEISQFSLKSRKWSRLYENHSGIGNKKIILLGNQIKASKLMVNITKAAISKFGKIRFSAYDGKLCELSNY